MFSLSHIDPNSFKIRASAGGKIMSDPVGKTPMEKFEAMKEQVNNNYQKYDALGNKETKTAIKLISDIDRCEGELEDLEAKKDDIILSKTCISHLEEWLKSRIYGREKELNSKYLAKGNIVEGSGIDLIADHYGLGMLAKNEHHYESEFMTGTPDVDIPFYVIDDKNSWDVWTMPLFKDELPENDYYVQTQIYMSLMKVPNGIVAYTLCDTPMHLIESEMRRYAYTNDLPVTEDLLKHFTEQMTYGDIPVELKVKTYNIEADPALITRIEQRVVACRLHLRGMLDKLLSNISNVDSLINLKDI